MIRLARWTPAAVLLLTILPLAPAPAESQGVSVEYTEVTRLEAPGMLGALLASSGEDGEKTRAIHVLETKMRTDDGSSSMIFDAADLTWTLLDHDARTWLRYSMADIREMTTEVSDAMRASRAELDAAQEEMEAGLEEARADMEEAMAEAERSMEVSVEHVATGRREAIHGYDAEHHQVIATVEQAEGIQGAEEIEDGSLVILLDFWISEELARENPLYAPPGETPENPFYEAMMENPAVEGMAEEMAEAFDPGQDDGSLTTFAMLDPRVGAAMGDAMERLSEVEGMPVRTTTVVAVLPPAAELDLDQLLAWEPESMGGQIRGEASDQAREAARDAARDAVSNLTGGLFGRGGDDEEDEAEVPEEELVIRPLFRLTNEVIDVRRSGTPSPDLFTIPEGYEELSFEMPSGTRGDG